MIAATTTGIARWMRGQLVELKTTMDRLLAARFCWYFRFLSVVTKTAKPASSAKEMSSPFFNFAQPSSKAVSTKCSVSKCRSGAGVPWSNKTRIHATANALRAACSSTVRACSMLTPGNHSTNWWTEASSSRFSNRAATGTRVPRKSHAPLTRAGSRSTAGQVDQSIMIAIVAPMGAADTG